MNWSDLRKVLLASYLIIALVPFSSCTTARGSSPGELAEVQRWVSAKFDAKARPRLDSGYLLCRLKNGLPEKNSRQGHPLEIAGKFFERGIHLPSTGAVQVHLPEAADRFSAMVGVDSNDISYYSGVGRGKVAVAVEVNGREVFQSSAMHEGEAAIRIDVSLQGATDFMILISGKSGSVDWNQIDLVQTKTQLRSGREVSLEDLAIAPVRSDYTLAPPFSFTYAGKASSEFLKEWNVQRSSLELDSMRTEHTQIYKDARTNLEVRLVGVEYHDFPVVEWTVYLKNAGTSETPILENIQALDCNFERNGDGEFTLHHNKGAPATPNDYEPYETRLDKGIKLPLSGKGGRPSNKDLPYFNLAWPGEGVIVVVGWPGQWAGQLTRDDSNGVHIAVGQELTHFRLMPGEQVRTPRIVMMFWQGEWRRSQNMWRRWMIAHNMPRPGGMLPAPQMAANTSREYIEMTEATASDEMMFIDRYVQRGLKPDYFWMDAGWYPNNGSWVNTGTWEVDKQRFPNGLKEISEHAHAKGVKIILWFEPERVTPGSWLYEHHQEWLLPAPPNPGDQLYEKTWKLFNFGNPEALEWMTNHVDKLIDEQGIDLYRQDFNMDPLYYWKANDAPDRQGITEIKYVTGYLAYWDELIRRHPNMLLDSCASGGRRNDIESLRRAVPLTRSDYLLEPGEPISQQMQTLGMAQWIPYFGTGTSGEDPYVFRSQMTPGLITSWDFRKDDVGTDTMQSLVRQWRTVSASYYGDFYPLTTYSLSNEVWAGLQFDRPEEGEGFVEIFRRSRSPYETARFKLNGLDPVARYEIVNLDSLEKRSIPGKELMGSGIEVRLNNAPGSALLTYRRVSAEKVP
jgi:alpha-galactosidase